MKRQTILVGSVSLQTGLAVVPQGLYVNQRLEKLNPSEDDVLLTFQNTWHKHQVLLVSKCRLNLNTAVGSFIIRYAFPNKTLADLTSEWDAVAINEGYMSNSNSRAYNLDNVLLLHCREYIKELYEEEMCIKRKREEAVRKAAERQAWIESIPQQVQSGKFSHPSIKD